MSGPAVGVVVTVADEIYAEHDGTERWELVVTVPPVVDAIKVLSVRCGLSVVEVRQGSQGWHAFQSSYEATSPRQNHTQAVQDARSFVEAQERQRLLTDAIAPAVAAAEAQAAHRYCGSNADRQSLGCPGHCEDCCSVGHVLAHPDLGCGDVGCYSDHDVESTRDGESRG